MGCCSSQSRDEFMVLILGLDAAGKTDILYRSLLQQNDFPLVTFGNVFNAEPVTIDDTDLIAWEVAGQESIRRLWMHYYAGTQGLIYVIDSRDTERMQEARDALFNNILSHPQIDKYTNIPLLIFCNKQDLPHAMSRDEICFYLDLYEALPAQPFYGVNEILTNLIIDTIFSYLCQPKRALNGRAVYIQECCSVSGDGIIEGMRWFIHQMAQHRDDPHSRPREVAVINYTRRNGESVCVVTKRKEVVIHKKRGAKMEREQNDDEPQTQKQHTVDIHEIIEHPEVIIYKSKVVQAMYPVPPPAAHVHMHKRTKKDTLEYMEEQAVVKEKAKKFTQISEQAKMLENEKTELRVVKRKKLKINSRVAQMAMNYDEVDVDSVTIDPILD